MTNIPAYVTEILPHERPPVYVLDGVTHFRVSAVGYCTRQLTLARLGYERMGRPLFLERAGHEGHLHEAAIITDMLADGWDNTTPAHTGGEQAILHLSQPLFRLIGHADLVGNPPESVMRLFPSEMHEHEFYPLLVEIKALSDAQYAKFVSGMWDDFPHYADQLTVAMAALGHTNALYVVKNRNTGEKRLFPVLQPPSDITKIMRKLNLVELLGRKGRLAEPEHKSGSFECMACPYRYACTDENRQYETGIELTALLNPAEMVELGQFVSSYRRAKAAEKQAKEILSPIRAHLEDLLERSGAKKLSYDGMAWQKVKGAKYLPVHRVRAVISPEVLQLIEEQRQDHMMVRDKGE